MSKSSHAAGASANRNQAPRLWIWIVRLQNFLPLQLQEDLRNARQSKVLILFFFFTIIAVIKVSELIQISFMNSMKSLHYLYFHWPVWYPSVSVLGLGVQVWQKYCFRGSCFAPEKAPEKAPQTTTSKKRFVHSICFLHCNAAVIDWAATWASEISTL